jgi:hypothetical protein
MKKLSRSEYLMMVVLFILAAGYGVWAKQDVTMVLMAIIGGGFLSKGAADLGKNGGKNGKS